MGSKTIYGDNFRKVFPTPLSKKIIRRGSCGALSNWQSGWCTGHQQIGKSGAVSNQPFHWSRIKPSGPLQAQLDLALDPQFLNNADSWVEITAPRGTTFYEGIVAAIDLKTRSEKNIGQLYGGGSQIYLDKVPEIWATAKGTFK